MYRRIVGNYEVVDMQRFYADTIHRDLLEQGQMLFVSGPRQVGKTTPVKVPAETFLMCLV